MDKHFIHLPINMERKYQSLKTKNSTEFPVNFCFELTIINKKNIL